MALREKRNRSTSLMNRDAKILNIIIANRIQQWIKKIRQQGQNGVGRSLEGVMSKSL